MTIGVVVADDQAIVRAGFRMLIDTEPDLAVLGEAANGAEAVAVARRTSPDVVLMDIRMPVLDGIEATRRITAAGPPASWKLSPRQTTRSAGKRRSRSASAASVARVS